MTITIERAVVFSSMTFAGKEFSWVHWSVAGAGPSGADTALS